ncbi:hypothetical protein ACJX0J_015692, partial [Zea mays]
VHINYSLTLNTRWTNEILGMLPLAYGLAYISVLTMFFVRRLKFIILSYLWFLKNTIIKIFLGAPKTNHPHQSCSTPGITHTRGSVPELLSLLRLSVLIIMVSVLLFLECLEEKVERKSIFNEF